VENELNGLLVTSGDTAQLTEALRQLIVAPSLRKQFGLAGQEKVQRFFEMRKSFADLHTKLTTLLQTRN